MISTAPTYSKIEIHFKNNLEKILNEVLKSSKSNNIKIFEDCGVMITGDYLLIIKDNIEEVPENPKHTQTFIYPLSEIEHYKIYNY